MTKAIQHDETGWWAEYAGATTQTFPSRKPLIEALRTERRLMKAQGLAEPAVPKGSPLQWTY